MLGQPIVAAVLGVVLGVALTIISHRASRMVTPDDPARGVGIATGLMGLRMLITIVSLAAYFILAREGFIFFAATLVVSFLVGLVFEAVKMSGPHASGTSG